MSDEANEEKSLSVLEGFVMETFGIKPINQEDGSLKFYVKSLNKERIMDLSWANVQSVDIKRSGKGLAIIIKE